MTDRSAVYLQNAMTFANSREETGTFFVSVMLWQNGFRIRVTQNPAFKLPARLDRFRMVSYEEFGAAAFNVLMDAIKLTIDEYEAGETRAEH